MTAKHHGEELIRLLGKLMSSCYDDRDVEDWKKILENYLPDFSTQELVDLYGSIHGLSHTSFPQEIFPRPEELQAKVADRPVDFTASSVVTPRQEPALDDTALAELVRDCLLEEKSVKDDHGMQVPFFHPGNLSWVLADASRERHVAVLRGYELAFGTVLEWFASLDVTALDDHDWSFLQRVVTRLCRMLLGPEDTHAMRNLRHLAAGLESVILRKMDHFPNERKIILSHVREAAVYKTGAYESRHQESKSSSLDLNNLNHEQKYSEIIAKVLSSSIGCYFPKVPRKHGQSA